jgi:hypothetical protein
MTTDLESLLSNWTGPSSATEQDKQERTERMIRDGDVLESKAGL